MGIPETDISILIPTYCYRNKVVRAVRSALNSGAGEIIVTDDHSRDGTVEALAAFSDPRLTIHENDRNLGLWENHLHALEMASRPWIKFIQADDYLFPGGLSAYASAAEKGVTVVWGAPTIKDDETGYNRLNYTLEHPRRITTEQLQNASLYVGWILGSPSHMMLKSDAIERDPAAWQTQISSDLVVGSIAATRGDISLLPPGALCQGSHSLQDGNTETAHSSLERMVASVEYLRARPEPGLRRFANLWSLLNRKAAFKAAAKGFIGREAPFLDLSALTWRLLSGPALDGWRNVQGAREHLRIAKEFRRTASAPIDLDKLLAAVL